MLIRNRRALLIGLLLGLSFAVVLALIFSPVFGKGQNGLQFADQMFNELAKGSSNFIPRMREENRVLAGRRVQLSLQLDDPAMLADAVSVLAAAGAKVSATAGFTLGVEADLGALMSLALDDAEAMYHNDAAALDRRYGLEARAVMVAWWHILKRMDMILKRQGLLDEAKVVLDIKKKAIETAHNFYGIEARRVSEEIAMMTGLLAFYVVYTMWWGFAIFFIFEGFGLTMKKAKVKQEV